MNKTEYIILSQNRGDYIAKVNFKDNGDFEIHGGSAETATRYTEKEAAELLAHLGRGFAVEPAPEPFQLTRTVSSSGPVYRGHHRECRIEAAADLNSFQVINDKSDCDTFERNGEDFVETHSSGVTEDWTESDFQTVINEINRLSSEEKRTEELKRLVIEKAGLNPEWAKDHFEIIS